MEAIAELYGIALRKADQTQTTLSEFSGKVLLLVNVASRCGFTPQYEGLEAIHEKYRARGFSVLGFPANEFGAQEPGSDDQIQQFCRVNYGVQFPVFAKLVAKGEDRHPLYRHLNAAYPKTWRSEPGIMRRKLAEYGLLEPEDDISWNFEKFLIGRKGEVAARFAPKVEPTDPMVLQAIEEELAK
jgi:glutathione peroxidase